MARLHLLLLGSLTFAAVAAVGGCDDKKPDITPVPTATASSSTVTVTTASVAPSASAPPTTSAVPSASASAATSAQPTASTSASAKAAPTCGDKPLPPCPLFSWMKANTGGLVPAQDYAGLATVFDKIATFAPPGMGSWGSIARDGAKAARDSNIEGVKGACRGCHDQYKTRYKKEMRDRKI